MGVPGGECGNVQTGGGDRVSTISVLDFSTSVALATGRTGEEEEEGTWLIAANTRTDSDKPS